MLPFPCITIMNVCLLIMFPLLLLSFTSFTYSTYIWSNTTDAPTANWTAITSDCTGQYLVAAIGDHNILGSIYTSFDYGYHWNLSQTAPLLPWLSIESDSTGQYVYAGTFLDHIYLSTDYGITWQVTIGSPIGKWYSIACDATGRQVVAVSLQEGVYLSNNYGKTWNLTLSSLSSTTTGTITDWTSITSCSTGQYLATTTFDGSIYLSNDYGLTWSNNTSPTPSSGNPYKWQAITSDSTGQYLAVVIAGDAINGSLFTSNDYGNTWIQHSTTTTTTTTSQQEQEALVSIASNSDGKTLITGSLDLPLYTSDNGGLQWNDYIPDPSASFNQYWISVASDCSGMNLVAVNRYAIYLGRPLPSSQPTSQPTQQPYLIPTSQPSTSPTSSPSSKPTLPSIDTIYETAHSVVDPTTRYLTATVILNNIGKLASNTSGIYLTVQFLQTGFSDSSFTVNIQANGYTVCTQCSVYGQCGTSLVPCCTNRDITYALPSLVSTDSNGPSTLTLVATSNIPYHGTLCSSFEAFFQVNYIISIGIPLPTLQPTPIPTVFTSSFSNNDDEDHESDSQQMTLLESYLIPSISLCFLIVMIVFAIMLSHITTTTTSAVDGGENDEGTTTGEPSAMKIHPLSLTKTIFTFILFAATFLAQVLSLTVYYETQYNPIYGHLWIVCKAFFMLCNMICIIWIWIKPQYQQYLHRLFVAKNKKLYGCLTICILFNCNLISFLPWFMNEITELTLGFPNFHLCYVCSALSVLESIVLTVINTVFAIKETKLLTQPLLQQYEFWFSLSFTLFNGIVIGVECLFLGNVKDDLVIRSNSHANPNKMNNNKATPMSLQEESNNISTCNDTADKNEVVSNA